MFLCNLVDGFNVYVWGKNLEVEREIVGHELMRKSERTEKNMVKVLCGSSLERFGGKVLHFKIKGQIHKSKG